MRTDINIKVEDKDVDQIFVEDGEVAIGHASPGEGYGWVNLTIAELEKILNAAKAGRGTVNSTAFHEARGRAKGQSDYNKKAWKHVWKYLEKSDTFHEAWGRAQAQPDYDKYAWMHVQRYLEG